MFSVLVGNYHEPFATSTLCHKAKRAICFAIGLVILKNLRKGKAFLSFLFSGTYMGTVFLLKGKDTIFLFYIF